MIKNFLMRKMLESKMKDVPEKEREMALSMIEKNPDLFKKIAEETQAEMTKGVDQMTAALTVMKKYQDELKSIAGK